MPQIDTPTNNPDLLDRIAKLFRQGLKDKEIGRELALSPDVVRKCRIKRGLRKNRR